MNKERQAIRIIPTLVEVGENQVLLNKVPYPAHIICAGNYYLAETKYFFVVGNLKNNYLFKILDKEYKVMPQTVFVAHYSGDSIFDVDQISIGDFLAKTLRTRPSNQTINLLAKAWGELKSRELNPLPGMNFKTNDNGQIVTNFKERQIAARFQLFRPSEMPYAVFVTAGYDLQLGVNRLMNMPPMRRKDLFIEALTIAQDKNDLSVVPSGIGTSLGDIFSKINLLPKEGTDYSNDDPEYRLVARVWKSQKLLGLGEGSMRVRSNLQNMLPKSSLVRTITVRTDKETFKAYIKVRAHAGVIGPVRSFKVKNHLGEKISLYETGQEINDAMDKWFSIKRIDLIYNAAERGYYIKFYIEYNYHAVRTGDQLLSYQNEFLKGVAVIDENIPANIDIECSWDNIKGYDYKLLEEKDDYVLIEINPLSLFITERGTSNARHLGRYDFNGHDAFEMMTYNELFPELTKEIAKDSDKRLSYFPDALNTFYRFKVTVNEEMSPVRFLIEAENFLKGNDNIFEDDYDGGYVIVEKRKFPLPSTELIMSMANEYDSGISHNIIVRRYFKILSAFIANGQVLEQPAGPRDYRPSLSVYKIITGNELYKLYKSPKLLAFSSIKRIINHMADVMHNIVAVDDNDPIVKFGPKYGIASVYPSVHPTQVKQKIVKIMKFSAFRKAFKEITGKSLPITSLDDTVLMNPHLVNQIFLKDNDGDALALRVPTNQKLMEKIYKKVTKGFWKSISTMRLVRDNKELWEDQEKKVSAGNVTITPTLASSIQDTGISGKLMIGMITRQARRFQYGLIQLLKRHPKNVVVINTAIIQIAKGMQDVIDGLKHERAVKEASQLYVFMRDFINSDWRNSKERKRAYARFFNSPITRELRPFLPELHAILQASMPAIRWLYGDTMDTEDELINMFVKFYKEFPNISLAYTKKIK